RSVLEKPRLWRLAWPGTETNLDRRPNNPRISKRGNRYLRALFVQAAWVVLIKVGPKHLGTLCAQVVDRSGEERTASQRPCHRARQQARAHCLERSGSWSSIRGNQASGCVISTRVIENALPAEVCEKIRNEMEDRSSRRMRTLVTRTAPIEAYPVM